MQVFDSPPRALLSVGVCGWERHLEPAAGILTVSPGSGFFPLFLRQAECVILTVRKDCAQVLLGFHPSCSALCHRTCSPWACTEAETSFLSLESSRSKQAVTAGTGTVRDLPGRPVPGEAVFAVVLASLKPECWLQRQV